MLKSQEEQMKVVHQRDILRGELDDAKQEIAKQETLAIHQKQVEKMLEWNVSSLTEKCSDANRQLEEVKRELSQLLDKYAIAEE